ncbi:9365_t:CDS:2, partial [Acaulospora morrowiae]
NEAYGNIEPIKLTKEEQEFFGKSEIEIERQVSQSGLQSYLQNIIEPTKASPDQANEKFKCLSIITRNYEKGLIFKEQNMKPAQKRQARESQDVTGELLDALHDPIYVVGMEVEEQA